MSIQTDRTDTLIANDYLSDPNDTHDTQSAYMGEYMRGLGI